MKNLKRVFALSAIALALDSGTAFAADQQDCDVAKTIGTMWSKNFPGSCDQSGGRTREQVYAETLESIKNGETASNFTYRPELLDYRKKLPGDSTNMAEQGGGKTREQVYAETLEAIKSGETASNFTYRPELLDYRKKAFRG